MMIGGGRLASRRKHAALDGSGVALSIILMQQNGSGSLPGLVTTLMPPRPNSRTIS